MNNILKILCGFAILLVLVKLILPSDKFKPYIELFISLGLAVTLILPVSEFLQKINFTSEILPVQNEYASDHFDIEKHSVPYVKAYLENALNKKFSQYKFSVRMPNQTGSKRIYLVFEQKIDNSSEQAIKTYLSDFIGISEDKIIFFFNERSE